MEKQKVKNVEISKIVIKIGEKEIPFTISEAKELLEVLENTLKSKDSLPVIPYYPTPEPWHPRCYWDITYTYDSMSNTENNNDLTLFCSLLGEK